MRALLAGIRRTHGAAARQKKPLLPRELEKIVAGLPADLRGGRDAALLLAGSSCELHRRLERDGVECFFDAVSIGWGENWERALNSMNVRPWFSSYRRSFAIPNGWNWSAPAASPETRAASE